MKNHGIWIPKFFYSVLFLLSLVYPPFAWSAERDSSLPQASAEIRFDGILTAFPVSGLKNVSSQTPVFYLDRQPVTGRLTLLVPPSRSFNNKQANRGDWLQEFLFQGLYHYAEGKPARVISSGDVALRWEKPSCKEENKAALVCTAAFSLAAKDGSELEPGTYLFRWGAFGVNAPFRLAGAEGAYFSVSRTAADEDRLNWFEFQGDQTRYPPSFEVNPKEAAQKRLERITQSIGLYGEFLKIRPDDDKVLLKTADAHESLGSHRIALDYYQKVLGLWGGWKKLKRVTTWNHLDVRYNSFEDFKTALQGHIERLERYLRQ